MQSRRALALTALLGLLGAAPASGQASSGPTASGQAAPRAAFAFQSIPGLDPAAVQHRGKILFATTPSEVHVFSAATRSFVTRPIAPGASLRFANDLLCVQEGTTFHAFAAHTGRFATLVGGPTARIVNPASQGNDGLLLVEDGATLHSFSGFTGRWTARTITPGARLIVRRDCALCLEASQWSGRSSFEDGWATLPRPGGAPPGSLSVSVDGNLGTVDDGTMIAAFSALTGNWSTTPKPAATGVLQSSKNLAVWTSGDGLLAVSAFRDGFVSDATRNAVATAVEDQCAVFVVENQKVIVFAAGPATFVRLSGLLSGSIVTDETLAMIPVTDGFIGVSGVDGTTHHLTTGAVSSVRSSATCVALRSPTRTVALYSSLGPGFVTLPPGALAASPTRNCVVLSQSNGQAVQVFDARTGRRLDVHPATIRIEADKNSAISVLGDAGRLEIFDGERGRMLSMQLPGPLSGSAFWRTTWIGHVGSTIFGFGALSGTLEQWSGPVPPTELRASSEVGAAVYPDGLLGFAASPDLDSPAQFPEFRRALPGGTSARFRTFGQPGQLAVLVLAPSAAFASSYPNAPAIPVSGILLGALAVGPDQSTSFQLNLPSRPALQGLQFSVRPLWLDPAAPADLVPGRPASLRIH